MERREPGAMDAYFDKPHTLMSITIDKVGLKDAQDGYVDAHFVVSVVASGTRELIASEPVHTTPTWTSRKTQYIEFGHTITFHTPMERLREIPGWAIFFELRHTKGGGTQCYATKDREYISTKCYSFMELDECQAGPLVLEVCKCEKPTDLARTKKPYLLSNKELYLHLTVHFKRGTSASGPACSSPLQ